MSLAKQVLESHKVNEVLLREKDRIYGIDKKGNKVKFIVKDAGNNTLSIHIFSDTEELVTLKAPNKDVKSADRELAKLGLIKAGSLEIMNESKISNEELSQDVQDKIKANNDKMSDLKANGGSQEEIDKLEKENDELNGGNKTAVTEEMSYDEYKKKHAALWKKAENSSKPEAEKYLKQAKDLKDKYYSQPSVKKKNESTTNEDVPMKFEVAMGKLANKPVAKQAEFLEHGLRKLVNLLQDKPALNQLLKAFSAEFLGDIQHGIGSLVDEPELEMDEAGKLKEVPQLEDIKTIAMSLKVSDMFAASFLDAKGNVVFEYDGYVPDFFPDDHYGDYVMLDIDVSGKITNWKKPAQKEFVKLKMEADERAERRSSNESSENPLSGEVEDEKKKEVVESRGLARKVLESHCINERDGLGSANLKLLKKDGNKLYYYFPKHKTNLVYTAESEPEMGVVKHLQTKPQDAIGSKIKVPFWNLGGNGHYMKINGFTEDGKVEVTDERGHDGFFATPEEVAILMTITGYRKGQIGDDKIAQSQKNIADQKDGKDVLGDKKASDEFWKSVMQSLKKD